MSLTALIDADSIVYAIGFSSQERPAGIDAVMYVEQPEIVSGRLNALLGKIIEKIYPYRIFISGSGNFRIKAATVQGYKANRTAAKPFYYDMIRNYLIETYNAEVVDGMEVDDRIADLSTPKTVCVSIDKDMDQIPGYHYNWRTKEFYTISELEAYRFYCRQLICGDTVDNIPGLYKLLMLTNKEKAARKLIWRGYKIITEKRLNRLTLFSQMLHYVHRVYKAYGLEEFLPEIKTLIKIGTKPDETVY